MTDLETKLSIAKLMEPIGEWDGPVKGQRFHGEVDPRRHAALVVNADTGWPDGALKPPAFRPVTDYQYDRASYLRNGFSPEDISHHEQIQDVSGITTGSEVEVGLYGIKNSNK